MCYIVTLTLHVVAQAPKVPNLALNPMVRV